jgi:BlaI family transcriptional regulator, penicillinase repressor
LCDNPSQIRMAKAPRALSPLEHDVMTVVWDRGPSTAETIGGALRRPLKNATVRTLLRRMEAKGYIRHRSEGRTFVYEGRVRPGQAASGAVRRIIDRFCGGSAATLLLGLVDEGVIDRRELRELEKRLAERKKGKP